MTLEATYIFGTCPNCKTGMAIDERKVRTYMELGAYCEPGCGRISSLHDVTGHHFLPHAAGIEACGIAVGVGTPPETCMTFRHPPCGLVTQSFRVAVEHQCENTASAGKDGE